MASKYWIKLYHEILHDPKMGRLPDHLWRRFVEFCLLAGENDGDGILPTPGDMAWTLRTDETEVVESLQELATFDLVELVDGHNSWVVTNFAKRQAPASDAERMKRYRDRKQKAIYHCDEPVTPPPVESYEPVTEHVTSRNADTDTDTEEIQIQTPADAGPTAYMPAPEAQPLPLAEFQPVPEPETPERGQKAPTEHQLVFSALAAAYRFDLELMTKAMQGRLNSLSKRVRDAGYGVPEINAAAVHWWTEDWRGKDRNQAPTDSQFFETLGKLRQTQAQLATVEASW